MSGALSQESGRGEDASDSYLTARDRGDRRRSRPLVLAIEDDPNDWEIYGRVLWYNGYDVERAADGEQGLELARDLRPDLILLDLGLPKLDGLSVCRRLRSDPETADVPVVALTAHPWRMRGAEAEAAGCTRYLEKVIGPVAVFHEVERLIGHPPRDD